MVLMGKEHTEESLGDLLLITHICLLDILKSSLQFTPPYHQAEGTALTTATNRNVSSPQVLEGCQSVLTGEFLKMLPQTYPFSLILYDPIKYPPNAPAKGFGCLQCGQVYKEISLPPVSVDCPMSGPGDTSLEAGGEYLL